MIASIRGKLLEKKPDSCIIDSNGMGMEVLIPHSTYEGLGAVDSEVRLLTHLYVREKELTLFGFASAEEKKLFRLLLSVSGIGPRLALGILSSGGAAETYKMISEGRESSLARIPGLGKKTAQRLIIDLKDKVRKELAEVPHLSKSEKIGHDLFQETVLALLSLGYGRAEAEKLTDKAVTMSQDTSTVEELVRIALTIKL